MRKLISLGIPTLLLGAAVVFGLSNVPLSQSAANPATIVVPEEQAVIAAVKKTRPAVVSIVAYKTVAIQPPIVFQFPNDFFNDPFFQMPQQSPTPSPRQEQRQVASGTGFIIESTGLMVTNKHVVNDRSATYVVYLADGRSLPGTIVAVDPANDIALLKISATGLPTVTLGNSDTMEVGQTVLAIGNSLGRYQNTVTRGVISGTGRTVVASDNRGGSEELSDIIQTDAAINPGNSGGPLVNIRSEVIGMNTAQDIQGQSIGFAIPINSVKTVVDSVKKTGKIIRPWLGVKFVIVTAQIQAQLKLPAKQGALLVQGQDGSPAVVENSPAFRAGLRERDVIQSIDEQTVTNSSVFQRVLAKHAVGDTIVLNVNRDGKSLRVEVKLGEAPQ